MISILIPVYNVKNYLRECLNSVIEQTYQDLEIICINDGSTDESGAILYEYEKKDSRIKVITQANSGYGKAMNAGLDAATGEYIGIVESDDFIDPEMYENLHNWIEESNADFVKTDFFRYINAIDSQVTIYRDAVYDKVFVGIDESPAFLLYGGNVWTGLYRRSFLENNNIIFLESPGASYQDISFNFKVFACAKRILLKNSAFYHYRYDNENSSVKSRAKVYCVCDELNDIEDYLQHREELAYVKDHWLALYRFFCYRWNYNRILDEYKSDFLHKWQDELSRDRDMGLIDQDDFPEEMWEQLEVMLADREVYFINEMKRIKELAYIREHMELIRLKKLIEILDLVNTENRPINIYGAGIRAKRLYKTLAECNLADSIYCFIVANINKNPDHIDEIPVYLFSDEQVERKEAYTIISLADKEAAIEVERELINAGYENVLYLSSEAYELSDYLSAKEYFESLDDRIIVTKKEYDEFGFCHILIDEEYMWRFYYTRMKDSVRTKDFFPNNRLLESYEKCYGKYLPLSMALKCNKDKKDEDKKNETDTRVKIYRAYGVFDKDPLKLEPPAYVMPIQLGTVFSDVRLCDITDDTGDNISKLNKDFSECTALYWIWKNDKEADYVGLFHYARYIDISEDELSRLDNAGIDMVITVPMMSGKPVKDFFCPDYISMKDWELMETAIIRRFPEYEKTLEKYDSAFCYPGANMSIMRRDIFDEYAKFSFTVALDITDYYEKNGVTRNDRYAGYIMENLLALFVMHNKDKYRIAVADLLYAKERTW